MKQWEKYEYMYIPPKTENNTNMYTFPCTKEKYNGNFDGTNAWANTR